ncbi:caspase family protein [Acrocarpospora catenulata]|uniref:caspase family protein n=1 Tax=Acrocarpospora catenulata TaxID=2836182 RepID=UPI001BDA79C0|nr:caspase family protein [Acrocarpospora catenulata]
MVAREGQARALLIAADRFTDPGLNRLRAPVHDVSRLAEVLGDAAVGGFDVHQVANRPASEVAEEIEGFFSAGKRGDLLLLYLSCHGIKDTAGRLYFAMPNTRLDRLAATGLSSVFVNEQMTHSRSDQIVLLLDCCYSGAFADGFAQRTAPQIDLDRFRGRGRIVISSSSALEYSYEANTGVFAQVGAPSIFTNALVEGLRTGDADLDADGLISVDELYDYVFDRVRRDTPNQTPEKVGSVRGDIVIARSAGGGGEPLPAEITTGLAESNLALRVGAVYSLGELLNSNRPGLARTARARLQTLLTDDSRRVSQAAATILRVAPADPVRDSSPSPGGETASDVARTQPEPEPAASRGPRVRSAGWFRFYSIILYVVPILGTAFGLIVALWKRRKIYFLQLFYAIIADGILASLNLISLNPNSFYGIMSYRAGKTTRGYQFSPDDHNYEWEGNPSGCAKISNISIDIYGFNLEPQVYWVIGAALCLPRIYLLVAALRRKV